MIKYSKKHKNDGDIIIAQNPNFLKVMKEQGYKFFGLTNSSIPKNEVIMVKANKSGQIEDIQPRTLKGKDLLSKYYHRVQSIYADKFISEVIKLMSEE